MSFDEFSKNLKNYKDDVPKFIRPDDYIEICIFDSLLNKSIFLHHKPLVCTIKAYFDKNLSMQFIKFTFNKSQYDGDMCNDSFINIIRHITHYFGNSFTIYPECKWFPDIGKDKAKFFRLKWEINDSEIYLTRHFKAEYGDSDNFELVITSNMYIKRKKYI